MLLELSTAEIGNRLRRAFGLRGRITTAVDETAFLAATVANLDAAPWRSEGLAYNGQLAIAAAAGTQSYILVTNNSPEGNLVTIDQIVLANQTGVLQNVLVGTVLAAPIVGGTTTTELPPSGAASSVDSPIGMAGGQAAIAPGGFLRIAVPIGGSIVIPNLSIVIQPGVAIRIFNQANNLDLVASVQGRFWPKQSV